MKILKDRVAERLEAVGISQFDAAEAAGFGRTYVYDLLAGKKETMRGNKLAALAQVLQCDPEYLLGQQSRPRHDDPAPEAPQEHAEILFGGYCEIGVWRERVTDAWPEFAPISPDARFPVERQIAFGVRDNHAAPVGIARDATVIAVRNVPVRDGDVIVALRRQGAVQEISIRKVSAGVAYDPSRAETGVPIGDLEVVGVVVKAVMTFG